MKNWQYNIGIFVFISVLGVLFVFAENRNVVREVANTRVEFVGADALFVTEEFVNKMLKESPADTDILTKETIDLNKVEARIEKQKHIEDAEVYLTVDGQLKANVVQRTPIARVFTGIPFYLDGLGYEMPLSSNYAIRVPLVFNYTKKHKSDLLQLLAFINTDEFLKKLIVGVYCLPQNDFSIKLRDQQFLVQTGGVESLQTKFDNFKAFYAKVNKDKLFKRYKHVNLEITNQVICTKV